MNNPNEKIHKSKKIRTNIIMGNAYLILGPFQLGKTLKVFDGLVRDRQIRRLLSPAHGEVPQKLVADRTESSADGGHSDQSQNFKASQHGGIWP